MGWCHPLAGWGESASAGGTGGAGTEAAGRGVHREAAPGRVRWMDGQAAEPQHLKAGSRSSRRFPHSLFARFPDEETEAGRRQGCACVTQLNAVDSRLSWGPYMRLTSHLQKRFLRPRGRRPGEEVWVSRRAHFISHPPGVVKSGSPGRSGLGFEPQLGRSLPAALV